MKFLKLNKALTGNKKKLNYFNFHQTIKKKIVRIYFFDEKDGFESTKRKIKSDLLILCLNGKATIEFNKKKVLISKKKPFVLCPKNNFFKVKGYKNTNLIFLSDKNY
jgi:hypothetical protein